MSDQLRAPPPEHRPVASHDVPADGRRDRLVPVGVTIGLHVVLLGAQGVAAALTGSVAIGANALHVAVGTGVHLLALGGIWMATRPADGRHPYGYERYEALASLLIGLLLLGVVALVSVEAIPRLIAPEPTRATGVGITIMAASAVATAGLAVYLGRRGRDLGSPVLRSEAVHAAADTLVALGVLVAVAAGTIGVAVLDPIAAVAVAGVVASRGWVIVRGATDILTDATAVDTEAIRAVAQSVPGVRGCHAVRSRGEARRVRVDLHIHVAPGLTIGEGHGIGLAVGEEIRRFDPGITEVLVHLGADDRVG